MVKLKEKERSNCLYIFFFLYLPTKPKKRKWGSVVGLYFSHTVSNEIHWFIQKRRKNLLMYILSFSKGGTKKDMLDNTLKKPRHILQYMHYLYQLFVKFNRCLVLDSCVQVSFLSDNKPNKRQSTRSHHKIGKLYTLMYCRRAVVTSYKISTSYTLHLGSRLQACLALLAASIVTHRLKALPLMFPGILSNLLPKSSIIINVNSRILTNSNACVHFLTPL